MKNIFKSILSLTVIIALLLPLFIVNAAAVESGNNYPIVLVHGYLGWGRDESLMNEGYYWGGSIDLQEELNDEGYEVYTAVVGPLSSNWDRACELYAYIYGGTVDYGKAHSEQFGHERYGRTFPGLYPEWGSTNGDAINKIHLIGHSQGGQTIRMLVQLLEKGMRSEVRAVLGNNPTQAQIEAAVENGTLSRLFTGTCNNWVESISTFAAPNDGTTLANSANLMTGDGELVGLLLAPFGGIAGISNAGNYDFKLDQWGLTREPDESYLSYFNRVINSSLWTGTQDLANYDLSTQGARDINYWVREQPNVYYFSYSCKATKKALLTDYQEADPDYMSPELYGTAAVIGSYNNIAEGVSGEEWYKNDGVINTMCQNGPKLGRIIINIVDYDGTPEKGVWNYMGLLSRTDHLTIRSEGSSDTGDLVEFYSNYIDMLNDL